MKRRHPLSSAKRRAKTGMRRPKGYFCCSKRHNVSLRRSGTVVRSVSISRDRALRATLTTTLKHLLSCFQDLLLLKDILRKRKEGRHSFFQLSDMPKRPAECMPSLSCLNPGPWSGPSFLTKGRRALLQTHALKHADMLAQGVLRSSSSGLSLWHNAWEEARGVNPLKVVVSCKLRVCPMN